MICKNCSTELAEGTRFCPYCGTKQEIVLKKAVSDDVEQPEAETEEVVIPSPVSLMVWGLVALGLCWIPIAGLILSKIAKKNVATYLTVHEKATKFALVGLILSNIAFPISIVAIPVGIVAILLSIIPLGFLILYPVIIIIGAILMLPLSLLGMFL